MSGIVSVVRRPWATSMICSGSSRWRAAHWRHVASTHAAESTRTPSRSNRSARHRSVGVVVIQRAASPRCGRLLRSGHRTRLEQDDGSQFVRPTGIYLTQLTYERERLLLGLAVDDVEPEDRLLRLRVRSISHQMWLAILPECL